jgi:hypothetical protein
MRFLVKGTLGEGGGGTMPLARVITVAISDGATRERNGGFTGGSSYFNFCKEKRVNSSSSLHEINKILK